jgi:hypothetical protein
VAYCVDANGVLRGIRFIDGDPSVNEKTELYSRGNMTELMPGEMAKCAIETFDVNFTSATVTTVKNQVVGLTLLDTSSIAHTYGITNFANQTDTSYVALNSTVVFTAEFQPIGLLGTSSSSEINSIGFVTFNQTCQQNSIANSLKND